MSAPQLPQQVSSDAREVWDWAARFSDHVHRLDKIRTLRAQIAAVGLTCGDCDNWMKSRQCPKEWNDNGRQRGPSMAAPRCGQFVLDRFAAKLRDERQLELSALKALGQDGEQG